ncbi:hypothetical protein A3740_00905 [Oleiphilus sp. HI0068]|nr:hypothetical protein A3740_00905 [Oleiphilus sp. HI0068]KZY80543.1 hypothetical protein A3741_05410 [Oleiphilus sp. HI0069]KZY85157.1 hypothetical protein A3741_28240 [Oleiphilus sp. HI0069]KZZ44435.1 hypothetical protein A3755_20780 [Oleiphilus sp. HI0085]
MAGHNGPYEALYRTLGKLRKGQSITQQELADRLGKPQSFVSKYESGERKVDVIEFIDIVHSMGLDPAQVLADLINSTGAPKFLIDK